MADRQDRWQWVGQTCGGKVANSFQGESEMYPAQEFVFKQKKQTMHESLCMSYRPAPKLNPSPRHYPKLDIEEPAKPRQARTNDENPIYQLGVYDVTTDAGG